MNWSAILIVYYQGGSINQKLTGLSPGIKVKGGFVIKGSEWI